MSEKYDADKGVGYTAVQNAWEWSVIRSHLAVRMAEKRIKIIDVARDTGIDRTTVGKLYHDRLKKLDHGVLDRLCVYFDCRVEDLLERTSDQ